ncbi:peptide-methionine (S)-S-oxide reductase MsrA [Pseudoalteromonas sp. SSM20]|uniref:peptide-methionine (S)-S-oxide reductase MsrA n=1 Tax=Pseudoalteromonas sp. SSM20 TaxID=3139394 RepID=UPI003BA9C8C1
MNYLICVSLFFLSFTNLTHAATAQTNHVDSIVLGSGCFWGAEKRYQALNGVIDAVSGYADGNGFKASYRNIIKKSNKYNPNNYAEVVKVTFNRNQISLEQILQHFYEHHDPTQLNRQGNDVGTQYRSTILYNSERQKTLAMAVTKQFQSLLNQAGFGKIATSIKPLDTFYAAEEYHQDYLAKNPNGYCPDLRTGVTFNQQTIAKLDNSALLKGKQILVIDAPFCPYCEKFKAETAKGYAGSIPLTFRTANQLHDLTIKTPTWATPTIILLEQGKEVFARQGYVSRDEFYKIVGAFKLGKGEAFNVAFNKGTDNRYCKQYEIFKNTPDGIFIDKLSGAALFDTRDRFNSGSGWLSFTKPVKGAVYEKPDHSFGMVRTEIRAVESDIHLGHVFDDGPNGQLRYCINATVLEFVPRS